MIEFKNVFYSSKNKSILNDISLIIEDGDFISIVGPSGSGKSTFLKLCCHLISPSEGTIYYNGTDIMAYNPIDLRKKVGYCFQTPYLFGDLVLSNIEYPFLMRNIAVDHKRVGQLLDSFNLDEEILKQDIKKLSGGEKQRLALIRALLCKPEVLLLDEVTSSLDSDNTITVENAINALNKEGITVLWVTHNQVQSRKYANKLLYIDNGEIKSYEKINADRGDN